MRGNEWCLGHRRPESDDQNASNAYEGTPEVYRTYIIYIGSPLLDEVAGHMLHRQSQQILDLGGEDGYGNTAGETYHDGVGNVLDDGS